MSGAAGGAGRRFTHDIQPRRHARGRCSRGRLRRFFRRGPSTSWWSTLAWARDGERSRSKPPTRFSSDRTTACCRLRRKAHGASTTSIVPSAIALRSARRFTAATSSRRSRRCSPKEHGCVISARLPRAWRISSCRAIGIEAGSCGRESFTATASESHHQHFGVGSAGVGRHLRCRASRSHRRPSLGRRVVRTYADAAAGALLALVGSSGASKSPSARVRRPAPAYRLRGPKPRCASSLCAKPGTVKRM